MPSVQRLFSTFCPQKLLLEALCFQLCVGSRSEPCSPSVSECFPPPPAGPLTTQSSANVPRQPDTHTPYHSPPLQHRVAFGLKLRKSLIRLVQTGGSASRLTQDEQFQIPILRTLAITWVHKCDDIGQGLP